MSNNGKRNFGRHTTALQVLEGIDLNGKTVLITGANNGIGLETARAMAAHNAHVIMACRNLEAAEVVKKSILQQYPNAKIDILYMDSSKLKTVESCASEFLARNWPLHILILNAGVYNPPEKFTSDGFESTFQVNHLAHFYLVQLLSSVILNSSPARIVHVSSDAHRIGTFNGSKVTREFLSPVEVVNVAGALKTYSRSKFCNVLFAFDLNRRWSTKGVTSNALHPGVVKTKISRSSGLLRFFLNLPFVGAEPVITPDKGAATSVYCATAPDLAEVGGLYYSACKVKGSHRATLDQEAQRKLWDFSEELIASWKQKGNA